MLLGATELEHCVERLFLHGPRPTLFRDSCLSLSCFVHHVLPCARGKGHIAGHKVGAGDLEIERRLLVGFVLCKEQAQCCSFLFGSQALLAFAEAVFNEVYAALAAEETIPMRHRHSHCG